MQGIWDQRTQNYFRRCADIKYRRKRKNCNLCFLGSGLSQNALRDKAERVGLTNVIFLPRVNQSEVPAYLAASDVLFLHLRDTPLFSLNIPSKMQAYMLASRPIIRRKRNQKNPP